MKDNKDTKPQKPQETGWELQIDIEGFPIYTQKEMPCNSSSNTPPKSTKKNGSK